MVWGRCQQESQTDVEDQCSTSTYLILLTCRYSSLLFSEPIWRRKFCDWPNQLIFQFPEYHECRRVVQGSPCIFQYITSDIHTLFLIWLSSCISAHILHLSVFQMKCSQFLKSFFINFNDIRNLLVDYICLASCLFTI